MSDQRHARVRALFLEAVERHGPARDAFLAAARAGDPSIGAEVGELVEHHDATAAGGGPRLRRLEDALGPAADAPPEIPGYRIAGLIGEGGMGSVYEAEQLRPIRRRVAIKLLKRGLDTREVLARFALEREALALTRHPNIARIFDAGETRDGRPFFAMERVEGEPLTHFCDRLRLDLPSRLRLFVSACEAVQHAHHNGIVHRDLKPSNVLVESFGGRPALKIIDFGIAKALWRERDGRTEQGRLLGTPAYMSPEQADPEVADVDTRTDVYSLGVLLYELLTGTLPFPGPRPPHAAGDEPHRPSARLRSDGDAAAHAAARSSDRRALARALRRDLDWIALRALAADRGRRYATASELAADVERFLADEPVLAGPPSTAYRLRKLARRHRLAVAVAVTFSLATLLGLVGTSVGLVRARTAEAEARQQARTAEEVSRFLIDVFQGSDPYASGSAEPTARELLARGRQRIEESFEDDPAVRGALMRAMGRVYSRLGMYDEAEPLLEEASRLHRETAGSGDRRTAAVVLDLAWLYIEQGRPAEAEPLLEQAIAALERDAGAHHADLAQAHQVLGVVLRNGGSLERGRVHLERSLDLRTEYLGGDHKDVAFSLYHLGWLDYLAGSYAEAEDRYRRALGIWERTVGADSALVGWCHNDLGVLFDKQWRLAEAQRHFERALTIQESRLGAEHPALAAPLHNLANLLGKRERHGEALTLLHRALEIRERALGPAHLEIARNLDTIGFELRVLERWDEAESYFLRALGMLRALGDGHDLDRANVLNNLASLYRRRGEPDRARALVEEALAIQEPSLGGDHPDLAFTLTNLALIDLEAARPADAAAGFERAAAIRERSLGEGYALGYTLCLLGEARDRTGEPELATASVARALEILARSELHPEGIDHHAECLLIAAELAAGQGRRDEAERFDRRAATVLARGARPMNEDLRRRRADYRARLARSGPAAAGTEPRRLARTGR